MNFFDKKTRGLVLRVSPKTKAWFFVYRHGGPPQWLRLGTYPAVSLVKARKLALNHRHAIEVNGTDPAAERRTPTPEPVPTPPAFTFADFVPMFIAFQKGKKKTWYDDENMIARHLTPAWGTLPLADITRTHAHEVLDTAVGKGLTVGVNRLQALISRIFIVALDRQLIAAHPAAKMIKRFSETARDRKLTDDEIRTLWAGLDAHPGAAADAIRLRLLLGQRGQETAGMLWSEVDLEAAKWSLPPTRTKNKHPHAVALPPTALALLKRRRAEVSKDEPRVFPALSLTSDEHKALNVLHNNQFTWKDLRRTASTRLAKLGFSQVVIDHVLNHAATSVTDKHYDKHDYVEEIRQALTAWDEELTRILAVKPDLSAVELQPGTAA